MTLVEAMRASSGDFRLPLALLPFPWPWGNHQQGHLVGSSTREAGTTASDYLARLLRAADPVASPDPAARVRSLLHQWQQYDHTPTAAPAPSDGTVTPSEALFLQWERENATLSDEARQAEEEHWQQFQQDVDAERRASGMRPIF